MEDFTFLVWGQGSRNGGVVHPFSQNAKLISKLPHNTQKRSKNKPKKVGKNGQPCQIVGCGR